MENTDDRILLTVDETELRAMIRERAFELSQIRQGELLEGSPDDDWFQAAQEIEPFVTLVHN